MSVVLIHGATADGSSTAKVIEPPAADGIKVLAAPLRSDIVSVDLTSNNLVIRSRASSPVYGVCGRR